MAAERSETVEGDPAQARVFQRMVAMKRVGFYRLLIERHEQHAPGYSLEAGLEDALVDYALEKLGRWRARSASSGAVAASVNTPRRRVPLR